MRSVESVAEVFSRQGMFERQPSQTGKNVYEVDGQTVIVSWRRFAPTNLLNPYRSVVFFGGWPGGESRSSIEELNQSMADVSGSYTFSLQARANGRSEDFLSKETEAAKRFISETMPDSVILSGHSLGGVKAIDLTHSIQTKDPRIVVKGLILFNSVGLYDTSELFMSAMSILENLVSTPRALLVNPFIAKRVLQAYLDIVIGIFDRFKNDKFDFFRKATEESRVASSTDPRIKDIVVPVVMLGGKDDLISDHSKIDRNIFRNSSHVRLVIGKKVGVHGLPLFRSKTTARVGLYLVDRANRVSNP